MSESPDFNTDGFEESPMEFADMPMGLPTSDEAIADMPSKGKKTKKVKVEKPPKVEKAVEPKPTPTPKLVAVKHIGDVTEFMGDGKIDLVLSSVSGRDYEWESGQAVAPWLIRRNYNGETLSENAQVLLTICQARPKYRTLQRRVAAIGDWLEGLNVENDRARARAASYVASLATASLEGEAIFESYVESVLSFSEELLAFSEMAPIENTVTTPGANEGDPAIVETTQDRTEIIAKWAELKDNARTLADTGFEVIKHVSVDVPAVEGE